MALMPGCKFEWSVKHSLWMVAGITDSFRPEAFFMVPRVSGYEVARIDRTGHVQKKGDLLLGGALDTLWEWHQEALNFEAPVVKPAPILTPCVCDIRNLMSTGHDAGCAHKGGKR